jgi:hypothetical protein
MNKLNKLSLQSTIIVGCLILGGFYYASQTSKQKSIEKQEQIKQDLASTKQELTDKQNECEALSSGVKKKWYNVMGVTYDKDFWQECVVTYTDTKTGEVKVTPLRLMKDN